MDLVQQFKSFLYSQEYPPSPLTVKNYLADCRRFILWYKEEYKKEFDPDDITLQNITKYKEMLMSDKSDEVLARSSKSIDRYISSLRKFFYFLKSNEIIHNDHFKNIPTKESDHLRQFRAFLVKENASEQTIKNYVLDVKQFHSWQEKHNDTKDTGTPPLETQLIRYGSELLSGGSHSEQTINRKLFSLKKYQKFLDNSESKNIEPKTKQKKHQTRSQERQPITFSLVAVRRSAEETRSRLLYRWVKKKDETNSFLPKVNEVKKQPWLQKSLSFPYYFHLLIILLYIVTVSTGITYIVLHENTYQSLSDRNFTPFSLTLPFKGKILTEDNKPVTSPTIIHVAIYTKQNAKEPVWEDEITVVPGQDGAFKTILGQKKPIPSGVVSDKARLYLGAAIKNNKEITPRQSLTALSSMRIIKE